MQFLESIKMNDLLPVIDFPGIFVATLILVLIVTLTSWHRDNRTVFDLKTIFVNSKTNTVSLHKIGQFTALIVSTLLIWYEAMHGRLSEWLFTSYMTVWAGVSFANKWSELKNTINKDDSSKKEE
jgi:hypothetical protein